MQYQVLCTFDLKNATAQNYKEAYADLDGLGLKRVQAGTPNNAVIPTTTVLGNFNYDNTNTTNVAKFFREAVSKAFTARRFTSEIFVTAGENGTWASGTT